jgi:rod shape-determining protein MreC
LRVRGYRVLGAILILAVVILLNLPPPAAMCVKGDVRDGVVPFQNVMAVLIGRVRATGAALFAGRDAAAEQRALIEQVARLREENRSLVAFGKENAQLRRLLGFKEKQPSRLILCTVVSRGGASGWWETVQLDRGSADGIQPNMAVLTPDGAVGRVREVSRQTADVLLVTDPECRAACVFPRTGAFGIARGLGVSLRGNRSVEVVCASRPFRVDYVDKEHLILPDDEVVTSGMGGMYPEGLPLGRVIRSEMDLSGLYRRVEIMPAVDLDALNYVFVVGRK